MQLNIQPFVSVAELLLFAALPDTLATQQLSLDTLSVSIELARELVRAAARAHS